MTLYETVKSNVTTLQAAERYGLKVSHNGMCKCPFHNDKNPSMKVDKRFHCFGCQADGDVINF
ncbi:MAG: DNA primase, partial [Clostridiales bacterium]|nr:DNA primase [Clostridiales bacterium]